VIRRVGRRTTVRTGADHRAGFTAVIAAAADGSKLPITIIKKGKTERSLAALRAIHGNNIHLMNNISGWSNAGAMKNLIHHVIKPFTKGEPAVLLIDSYRAHMTSDVIASARAANLYIIVVPPNTTARRQPLDVTVMGALKAPLRTMWREHIVKPNEHKLDMGIVSEHLYKSWEKMKKNTIINGFKIALEMKDSDLKSHDSIRVILRKMEYEPKKFRYALPYVNTHYGRARGEKTISLRRVVDRRGTFKTYEIVNPAFDDSDGEHIYIPSRPRAHPMSLGE
jgi:hypothetical protein